MTTPAQRIIIPKPNTFRTVFLFVGQGEATLHIAPDGRGGFKYILVDMNHSEKLRSVDVVALLEDLLPRQNGRPTLDMFINTHPHNDHLGGIGDLRKRVNVREVWHTGFRPSQKHDDAYGELQSLMNDVSRAGGNIVEYRGTREECRIGEVTYNVLSPADHTKEEIDDLDGEARDKRIHDYCGVLRFRYGAPPRHVMITGDADKSAWQDFILGQAEYQAERLPCTILSAGHHGSRSFFKEGEDDENPYTRHLELMAPDWLVISSPKQADSPHGHPHDDAIALYKNQLDADHIRVLGERPECIVYDVTVDGFDLLDSDGGELIEAYPTGGEDAGDSGSEIAAPYVATTSRIDSGRPMGELRDID